MLKAVAKALAANRHLLVSLDNGELVQHAEINIGMAVALDSGLIVPVIKNAERLSLSELAAKAGDLAKRARSGELRMEEYQDATFSVSNLGMYGIESFTPIVNPPQTGILGVCAALPRVLLKDGVPVSRPFINLSLTYDHRALDGGPASKFLQAMCRTLEGFTVLLAE
jgi:pyruvate dehydrogenase E2 component (dihydrolipoamide acetyltransferase)